MLSLKSFELRLQVASLKNEWKIRHLTGTLQNLETRKLGWIEYRKSYIISKGLSDVVNWQSSENAMVRVQNDKQWYTKQYTKHTAQGMRIPLKPWSELRYSAKASSCSTVGTRQVTNVVIKRGRRTGNAKAKNGKIANNDLQINTENTTVPKR